MKKIGIVTINGNNNYGNRLQNYSLLKILEKLDFKVETIWIGENRKYFIKKIIKRILPVKRSFIRFNNFSKFTNKYLNVKYYKDNNIASKYDNFIAGSDQIWNYNWKTHTENMFLHFSSKNKNISYAASIGVDEISTKYIKKFKKGLNNFKSISVREDKAKEIVEKLTNRNDIEVSIDPTMLLSSVEWDKISKKPRKLKAKKYILNYFLGNLSEKRKKEIQRIANDNNCEIISILDKSSDYYSCGPSEYLYLEKNAFLICTDSFHSCVFSIIYNKPFIVFDREDEEAKMGSRIDTLIEKFKLKNRKFEGKITKDNLEHDYSNAYEILESERKKSMDFLKRSLEIEDNAK